MDVNDPVLANYATCGAILGLKMLLMSEATALQRFRKKVVSNPEDVSLLSGLKVTYDDPDVERVRRAHQNDLENIPIFLAVGGLYMLTKPEPQLAINLYRGFATTRILHTLVYAFGPVPQPARGIAFLVGWGITGYMAVKVIQYFW